MRQFLVPVMPADGTVIVQGRDYRYLVQVLRLSPGDCFDGRLPDGSLCSLEIRDIRKSDKTVLLAVRDAVSDSTAVCGGNMPPPELPANFPRILLFQWLLKGQKMDTVIRQAAETGVFAVIPVAGERSHSITASDPRKEDRWNRIIREARQQSGSPIPTEVHRIIGPADVPAVREELSGKGPVCSFLCTEAPLALKSLHEYLVSGAAAVALVNGPEGGLTAGETEALIQSGFFPVHFKTNILRAETCALYSVAAVQNALTELETWRLKD